jgi:hypothetical protein
MADNRNERLKDALTSLCTKWVFVRGAAPRERASLRCSLGNSRALALG